MLNPVAASNTANTAKWNQSMPKCHRYNGTAVSVRRNVPIKNELVVQLTRLIGMRKMTRGNLGSITGLLMSAENNVLLCPSMNAAAVRAGELLRFYFRRPPAFLFYCQSGIGQL